MFSISRSRPRSSQASGSGPGLPERMFLPPRLAARLMNLVSDAPHQVDHLAGLTGGRERKVKVAWVLKGCPYLCRGYR